MIVPSLFHEPPTPVRFRAHKDSGGPPDTSIFRSSPPASKPIKRLSGDQNSKVPSDSVPAKGRISRESMGRIHMRGTPSELTASKANWRPSGESANKPIGRTGGFADRGI